MKELVENLPFENALILSAPPGWGKTYKLLHALKQTKRKTVFVFPLRALCEEVYLSASKINLNVCNLRKKVDLELLNQEFFDLVITTPECLDEGVVSELAEDYLFILDEAHLFYYWGEDFRPSLKDFMQWMGCYSPATIFLSATLNARLLEQLTHELSLNYKEVIHLNFGNQMLKNYPAKIFYYPKLKANWILDDIRYSKNSGVKLIFCPYRKQVKELGRKLSQGGLRVLSCIGGEASEFTHKLNHEPLPDVIVATSVVSHGVNLPAISKVYFLYQVDNLDFYLQMVGRGGRDATEFELHTLNRNYFSRWQILRGFGATCIKRIRNKMISLL